MVAALAVVVLEGSRPAPMSHWNVVPPLLVQDMFVDFELGQQTASHIKGIRQVRSMSTSQCWPLAGTSTRT